MLLLFVCWCCFCCDLFGRLDMESIHNNSICVFGFVVVFVLVGVVLLRFMVWYGVYLVFSCFLVLLLFRWWCLYVFLGRLYMKKTLQTQHVCVFYVVVFLCALSFCCCNYLCVFVCVVLFVCFVLVSCLFCFVLFLCV